MGAYLTDHPPVRDQWYAKRNRPLTGCTVLHTAESVMDTVGPDTGAEAVAEFIRTRTTPGSYHDLVDSDSALQLVEYGHAAYHDGTGSNNWALSISFACSTSDWQRMNSTKRRAFLRNGARAFVRQQAYRRTVGAPLTEPRRITKAQSDAGMSGFIYHGDRDPARRSDPGKNPPNLFPIDEFITECRAVLSGQEEDDMYEDTDRKDAQATKVGVVWALVPEDGFNSQGEVTKRIRDIHGQVTGLNGALNALASLVAQQNGLALDDVRRVVAEEVAKGVDVDVTVSGSPAT